MKEDLHGRMDNLETSTARAERLALSGDLKMDLTDYIPDNFEEESEDYQRGFIEACVTMMIKGKIVPDSESN